MNVLVTGATGYFGRALTAALVERGHHVVGLSTKNCDLRDIRALTHFPHVQYERIYHLAAWTQAGDFCLRHPGEQWINNQQLNTSVLTWWQREQPQAKLIAIGTSCSYDENLPLSEDNYLTGVPTPSLYTYALTKRMLLVGLLALAQQFSLRYLHVVPSTLYGPGYPNDGRQRHFIFDLITKILRGKYHGEPVVLWGDGYQKRELVYRDDAVRFLLMLADRVDNETVNLGGGVEATIREFARLICAQVGFPFDHIHFDASAYVGVRAKLLSVAKLKRLLPSATWTPLEIGLARTVEWMERPFREQKSS